MHSLQADWSKDFASIAAVVQNLGQTAIDGLYLLDNNGVHLNAGLLRACFEGLLVPDDQSKVFTQLAQRSGKLTATIVKEVAQQITEDRWWSWLILHPGLTEAEVHPSRSVSSVTEL